MKLRPIISLLRPRHYIKNFVIFLPLFFAGKIGEISLLLPTTIAFAAFCLIASAVYVMNDLADIEADRRHERKRLRPLAAGTVFRHTAIILYVSLVIAGIGLSLWFTPETTAFLAIYCLLNLAYTFILKKIPIIDIATIASGFVIRLLIGSAVTGVPLSSWIILIVFLFCLFLGFAERREDILLFLQDGTKARTLVNSYNLEFLNTAMTIMASVVIVSYILYTVSPDVQSQAQSESLQLTSIFVILAILRYMQLSLVHNDTGSPVDVFLRDRFTQLVVIFWIVIYWLILYP